MREPSQAEYHATLSLGAPARYADFVEQVAERGVVWSLSTPTGWVLAKDGARELVPMWPRERYAVACATDAWLEAAPERVDLAVVLGKWLDHLARRRRWVAVFPVPAGRGIPVSPERLHRDLTRAVEERR